MIVLVCGFGRCGSSLVMQMLEAGGFPVAGSFPDFECEQVNLARGIVDRAWLDSIEGHAVKILDPHKIVLPSRAYRSIWLDRDATEQAKSQVKFLKLRMGISGNRSTVKGFAALNRRDRPKAMAALCAAGSDRTLTLAFENLLSYPFGCAKSIAVHLGAKLDLEAMARAVRPREARCAPGLDIEMNLLRERGVA
jgi:hypothetical protein